MFAGLATPKGVAGTVYSLETKLAYFPKIVYFLEQENDYKKENTESKRDGQPAQKREGRSAAALLPGS
jgi:hypothetical protein